MSDDSPIRSNGTQHTTRKMLSIFWNSYSVYVAARLKPLGKLVADVTMEGRNPKL